MLEMMFGTANRRISRFICTVFRQGKDSEKWWVSVSTLSFYIYLSYKESDDIIQFVMLTLHAAIATVLEIHRVPLCAKELADEINRRRLYIRRDRTLLRSSQIHARVKNYPALFEKSGGVITLKK